jgi:hypothetical protein
MATIVKAKSPCSGNALYQKRARLAFPLLVRQALVPEKITYTNLGLELEVRPRNLNYVLGSIAQGLIELQKQWGTEIPPLTAIVVNRQSGLPGDGLMLTLITEEEFKSATVAAKRAIVDAALSKVYAYRHWREVLAQFGLQAADIPQPPPPPTGFGGPESDAHVALKKYVRDHPEAVGIPINAKGKNEYLLPSGDRLDVHFKSGKRVWAVEVKTADANTVEIRRGLFQCVKYDAVLRAYHRVYNTGKEPYTRLVLEGVLPKELDALRSMLNLRVIERISPVHKARVTVT